MDTDQKIWDETSVLSEFKGDEDILLQTCATFLNLYGQYLSQLWSKCENRDYLGASDEAHSIKGMVGCLNRGIVVEAAINIEEKLMKNAYTDHSQLTRDIENLEQLVNALADYLREFLKKNQAA